MPGIEDRVVRQLGQLLREAVVHVLGATAGQIDTAAGVNEQGIASDQPVLDQKTLRTRRVPRGMDERHRSSAHSRGVTAVNLDEVRGRQPGQAAEEPGFSLVDIHLGLDLLQQLSRPLDVIPAKVTPQMILVVMGHQRLGNGEPVLPGDTDEGGDIPGRVYHQGFTTHRVADQVGEVLHRPDLDLFEIE